MLKTVAARATARALPRRCSVCCRHLRLAKHLQSRPNVYFEAGMAFISHLHRTIIVEIGNVRPFSDIVGRHTIRLDDSPEARRRLINRLRVAKCEVDDTDGTWRTAGRFIEVS